VGRSTAILQVGIAFTWAGLVLGLSFIETPLKFQAPGVTTAIGVGIGRLVFAALNRVELVLAAVLLASFILGNRNTIKYLLVSLILLIVSIQTFWLLPALDARAQLLIDGSPLPASIHHNVFVVVESLKVLALLALGIVAARHFAPMR
jgi:hypothetical protein